MKKEDIDEILMHYDQRKVVDFCKAIRSHTTIGLREAHEMYTSSNREKIEKFLEPLYARAKHFSKEEAANKFMLMLCALASHGKCHKNYHDLAEDLFGDRMGEC